MIARCEECGATQRFGSCHDLFMGLLALDYGRKSPWAAFHAMNVACYLLQHPSAAQGAVLAGQWHVVQTFIDGGLGAVRALAEGAVRRNSHRAPQRHRYDVVAAPAVMRFPAVTIETVSVDGTFPAAGFEDRMSDWIKATASSRTEEPQLPADPGR